jgi:hypothetical protein
VAVVCLAALLGLATGSASAANWSVRRLPPKQSRLGGSDSALLNGVSCVGESFCLAVGALDTIASSTAPTGGAEGWQVVYPLYAEPDPRCMEEEGETAADCSEPRGSLQAVSCASTTLCVAVGHEGSVYSSTDPTGGAGAWSIGSAKDHGSPHLLGVSCPSNSLCVAVSGENGGAAGRIVTSTAPTSGKWQTVELPGAPDLRGVSCASTTLCVAVGAAGKIFVSIDPTGGASSWREIASPTARELRAVSCVAGLCAAGDEGGNLVTSTDPGGGPFAAANGGGTVQLTGASCPTASACVAVDDNADVVTSTDPTGGTGAWNFQNLIPFEAQPSERGQFVGNALWGVSCGTPSLCVLVGSESRIWTSTAPFAVTKSSPKDSGGGAAGKRKGSLRPHTHLVFAKGSYLSIVARHRRAKAGFRFYSREGARGFVCRRDKGHWRPCHSPTRYWAARGHHVFRVRAIGRTGLRGPVSTLRFRVVGPGGH